MPEHSEPQIRIGQVFLSFASFDHREDALQLPTNTPLGEIAVQLDVQIKIAEDGDGGIIRLRAGTKPGADDLYRFRVEMTAMVAHAGGVGGMTVKDYLMKSGAFMVYPFLREAVANLTIRGRFGPVWLRPINFMALAEQMNDETVAARSAPET